MSKAITLKNNIYLDSNGVVHRRKKLNEVLDSTIKYFETSQLTSLKDFVESTAIGYGFGMCKICNNNDFLNIGSSDWVKVIYMYQNFYSSGWGVNGIAFVTNQSGRTWLVVISGSSGSYTATPTALN